MLIAIFVLLLIGVVAIALVVSSGTESALAGNYRSSTSAYYAAVAGLEEARARLRANDPNSLKNVWNNFYPAPGTVPVLPIGKVAYVLNPGPNDGNILTTYQDLEYDTEFGPGQLGGATVVTAQSIWSINPQAFPPPLYKWVRVNAVSENSINLDVDNDGRADATTPLYYDNTNPANLHLSNNSTSGGQALQQALEITALAVLPDGSQKLVQYLVAPLAVNLPTFPAALTLLTGPGNNVAFQATTDPSTNVRGIDQDDVGACTHSGAVAAIGVLNNPDKNSVIGGILPATGPLSPRPHYTGVNTLPPNNQAPPDVQVLPGLFPANFQTVAGLQALVQSITQNADVVINGSASGSGLPSSMSATNPLTIVVNGDLDLTGWSQTGYGLLLVTGNFKYDAATFWRGIILVIGQGTVTGSGSGNGDLDGVVFVANTVSGSNLGSVSFNNSAITSGEGIHYSSCWVQAATPVGSMKILSFHEISQ